MVSGSQNVVLEGAESRLGTERMLLLTESRKVFPGPARKRSLLCQSTLIDGPDDLIGPLVLHLSL